MWALYVQKAPDSISLEKNTAQIMTLLTYSPVREDYKLDTYQDTCVKQLMIVETKGERNGGKDQV